MKKSLLLTAIAAIALTASAQRPTTHVRKYLKTLEPKALLSKEDISKKANKTRGVRRLTTQTPKAQMWRATGIFWLGMDYLANGGGAYGLAAPGVDIPFYGSVTGESSKWKYASAVAADGTITYSEQALVEEDTILYMNLKDAYVPNPELTSTSQVGTSRLNAKTVTDTAATLFTGIQFGGGTYGYLSDTNEDGTVTYYDLPICNYSLNDYVGSGSGSNYLAVNSATAANALGTAYGVSNMTIKAATEFFYNETEAPMYITGGDAWIVSDEVPTNENLKAELMGDLDWDKLGEMSITDVKPIYSQSGQLMAYGVHFAPAKPVEIYGSFHLSLRPADGSTFSFSPRLCVVDDTDDGCWGYVVTDFTYNDKDYEDELFAVDIFNWGDGYATSGHVMGLTMSFSKTEAEDVMGVESVKTNSKPDAIYDLQGRRVAKTDKGIFIVNGKKVIK